RVSATTFQIHPRIRVARDWWDADLARAFALRFLPQPKAVPATAPAWTLNENTSAPSARRDIAVNYGLPGLGADHRQVRARGSVCRGIDDHVVGAHVVDDPIMQPLQVWCRCARRCAQMDCDRTHGRPRVDPQHALSERLRLPPPKCLKVEDVAH